MSSWLDRSISQSFNEMAFKAPPVLPLVNLRMFQSSPQYSVTNDYWYNKEEVGYDVHFYRQAPIPGEKADGLNYGRKLDEIAVKYPDDGETIYFDSGRHHINPGLSFGSAEVNTAKLDRLAAFLTRPENKDVKVTITGHTDTVGSTESNDILSDNRAQAVLNYLLRKGVSPRQLERVLAADDRRERLTGEISNIANPDGMGKYHIEGQGEHTLAKQTADETDELANRRVEIELVYDDPMMRTQLIHNIQVTSSSVREFPFSSNYLWARGEDYIPGRVQFSVDQNAANDKGPVRYTYIGDAGHLSLQGFYLTANGTGGNASFSLNQNTKELTMQVDGQNVAIFKLNVPDSDLEESGNLNLGINTLKADGTTQFTPVTLGAGNYASVNLSNNVPANNRMVPTHH